MVFCLPLYHPVRLVQEICMLDQICEGRFMPGVGRGIRDVEHEWFGLDPAEAGSRFEETFAVIVRGLAVGRLDFEGRYYRFKGVPLDLEPLQRPYPPFWYAGNLEAAGRRGLNALGGGSVRRESLERYWELWQESRRAPEPVNPQQAAPVVGSTRHMFLADTDAEAVAVARRAWGVYRQNFNATSTRVGGVEVGRGSDPVVDAFERAVRGGSVLAGSPDSIREQVASYLDEVGPLYNYFAGAFQWGDISHEEALHSIGLFATQVMPSLAARSARGVTV
jgi:alkanesulfonate monooxygenase SsuD/methylene tetrahydromethanopterin reductase-like flavin-dependent oxidoreductase (luciferase family)